MQSISQDQRAPSQVDLLQGSSRPSDGDWIPAGGSAAWSARVSRGRGDIAGNGVVQVIGVVRMKDGIGKLVRFFELFHDDVGIARAQNRVVAAVFERATFRGLA